MSTTLTTIGFSALAAQFQMTRVNMMYWQSRAKANLKGLAPISLRITIEGKRLELSTGIRVLLPVFDEEGHETTPGGWDVARGCLRGKGRVIEGKNQQLDLLKAHVLELVNLMKATGRKVTAKTLKQQLISPNVGASPCFIGLCQQQITSCHAVGNYATLESKRYALNLLIDWHGRDTHDQPLPLPLDDFAPPQAATFYGWLLHTRKVKVSTANTVAERLKSLFRGAVDSGGADENQNPFRSLRKQKAGAPPARLHLSLEEVAALRDAELPAAPGLARDVYLTQYYLHGSRVGAVLKLCWGDVTAGRVNFKAEKSGPQKSVLISAELGRILHRYHPTKVPQASDLIFPYLPAGFAELDAEHQFKARKTAITNLTRQLRLAGEAVGITGNLHSHTARHTLALHAYELSGGLELPREMLGHATSRMTERYVGGMRITALDIASTALYGPAGPTPTPSPPTDPEAGKVRPMWAA